MAELAKAPLRLRQTAANYSPVIVTCKMTPEEELRDMATRLDELLELESRSLCLDELYTFAIERLHLQSPKCMLVFAMAI